MPDTEKPENNNAVTTHQEKTPRGVSPVEFTHSSQYWDDRYRQQGHSGAGSYGRLALFKAKILNTLVKQNAIQSVIEFGSGDGNQLSLAEYPQYTGFDVSPTALARCQQRFANDNTKQFLHTSAWKNHQADLTLSLDVIYHLIEDEVFEEYMHRLFSSARRFVAIYASNDEKYNQVKAPHVKHVRHRKFTDWIQKNPPANWVLSKFIPNDYPFNISDMENTSFADFYIFKKIGSI